MRKADVPPPDAVIVDCATGDVTCTPLTPEEIAARQAAADQWAAQQQAAADARATLIATVAASTDPALLALAKLVGLIQ